MISSYVTVEQLESVRNGCVNSKNVSPPFSAAKINMKRGAYRDSGPIGLSLFEESFANDEETAKDCSLQYRSIVCKKPEGNLQTTGPVLERASDVEVCDDSHQYVPSSVETPQDQLIAGASVTPIKNYSYAQSTMRNDKEWTLVQRQVKKSKNRIEGKTGTVIVEPDEMFRAAERTVPVFITNVHQNTSESDIVRYILKRPRKQPNYNLSQFIVWHNIKAILY